METVFDQAKGVYRVNKPDGSFETYTALQYQEKFGEPELKPIKNKVTKKNKSK